MGEHEIHGAQGRRRPFETVNRFSEANNQIFRKWYELHRPILSRRHNNLLRDRRILEISPTHKICKFSHEFQTFATRHGPGPISTTRKSILKRLDNRYASGFPGPNATAKNGRNVRKSERTEPRPCSFDSGGGQTHWDKTKTEQTEQHKMGKISVEAQTRQTEHSNQTRLCES